MAGPGNKSIEDILKNIESEEDFIDSDIDINRIDDVDDEEDTQYIEDEELDISDEAFNRRWYGD